MLMSTTPGGEDILKISAEPTAQAGKVTVG
jgi:hypothetical protein